MKRIAILAAALAATALPLPAAAQAAPDLEVQIAEDGRHQFDHIRTRLHGDAGPLVVLIPGMSTPEEVWDEQVAALKIHHRLLVVEVRGFDGERGTANERDGAIPGIVADLAADLDARGLVADAIVGHSLGGLIAMRFGLDRPDLARRLLIVDSLPWFATIMGGENMTMEAATERAVQWRDMTIKGAERMREMGIKGITEDSGALDMSYDPEHRLRISNWTVDAEPLAVAQLVYEDVLMDLRSEIADLAMPVTLMHMANGAYADMAKARYATDYAALKQVRIVPIDGTGHFIQLDKPQQFRAELAMLLSR